MSKKHRCSPCKGEFDTDQEYLDHTCKKSGHKPTEANHLIKTTTPNFDAISAEAKVRGQKRIK